MGWIYDDAVGSGPCRKLERAQKAMASPLRSHLPRSNISDSERVEKYSVSFLPWAHDHRKMSSETFDPFTVGDVRISREGVVVQYIDSSTRYFGQKDHNVADEGTLKTMRHRFRDLKCFCIERSSRRSSPRSKGAGCFQRIKLNLGYTYPDITPKSEGGRTYEPCHDLWRRCM